jgi:hypothetical protein
VRLYTIRIPPTPSEMGDSLLVVFKCSNSTSLYCDDNYMDDVDYFIIMVYVNQYCFDTFACLD